MYTRVGGASVVAAASGAGLAKTGFSGLLIALMAIVLVVNGLLLLRIAAIRRRAGVGAEA